MAAPADGPDLRIGWFAIRRPGWFRHFPASPGRNVSGAGGPLHSQRKQTKETKALLSAPMGNSGGARRVTAGPQGERDTRAHTGCLARRFESNGSVCC